MKTILVPTDFSKTAQLAVEVAADVAKRAEAELILLHVIEEPSETSINITGEVDLSEAWEDRGSYGFAQGLSVYINSLQMSSVNHVLQSGLTVLRYIPGDVRI